MTPSELKQFIQNTATQLGFSHVGISPAYQDTITTQRLNQWINNTYHASMEWMYSRAEERRNINKYFPGAKSVVSLSMNYFTGNAGNNDNIGKISNYAWGDDYHRIIKPRLYELLYSIQSILPGVKGIVCIDTSPVMEKSWAQQGGLGWMQYSVFSPGLNRNVYRLLGAFLRTQFSVKAIISIA